VKPGQAASSLPLLYCRKPGPLGTIAKVVKERKEKPQKRLKKWAFFRGTRESGPKTRLLEHFGVQFLEAGAALVDALTIITSATAALNDYAKGRRSQLSTI
jgi:hypothetical protein